MRGLGEAADLVIVRRWDVLRLVRRTLPLSVKNFSGALLLRRDRKGRILGCSQGKLDGEVGFWGDFQRKESYWTYGSMYLTQIW